MKTEVKTAGVFGVLALLLLVVNVSQVNGRHLHQHNLLEQIFNAAKEANRSSQALQDTYVDVVFDETKCEPRDFCIAQKIISHATGKDHAYSVLARALRAYCKMDHCPYTPSRVKYPLSFLTENIVLCVQNQLSQDIP